MKNKIIMFPGRGTNKEKEVIEHFKAGFFGNIPDALNAFPKEKSTESDDELKQIRQVCYKKMLIK